MFKCCSTFIHLFFRQISHSFYGFVHEAYQNGMYMCADENAVAVNSLLSHCLSCYEHVSYYYYQKGFMHSTLVHPLKVQKIK